MLRPPSRLPFWRRALVPLALAYLLVAQLVLGGAATAEHAGRTLATDVGLLCAGGTPDGPDGSHAPDALCCVLGCAAAVPMPSLDGAAGSLTKPLLRISAAVFAVRDGLGRGGSAALGFHATGPPARV